MKLHEYRIFIDADAGVSLTDKLGGALYDYEFLDTHILED